jgi:hypothetical protein
MLPAPRRLLVLTGALWIPLLLWWFALLPGGMSNDSFNSWAQIKGRLPWSSHHPPPFTALFWLTSLGGTTPATTSLVQTLMMAFALAFFATSIGVVLRSTRAVWICAAVLAVAPLVGPFAVTIWKDIPETAALLGVAGLLVLGWRHEGPLPRWWWAALAATSLAVGLFRWNGGPTAVVAAVLLVLAFEGARRWTVAGTVAVAGMLGFAFLTLLPHVSSVKPVQPIDSKADRLADLAQFARNTPGAFSPADRAVLERVAPFQLWAHYAYSCVSVDPVTYSLIRYHHLEPKLNANVAALSSVWAHVARKEPRELLHARACRSSLAWSFADPPRRQILTAWPTVNRTHFGIHQLSPAPIRHAAVDVARLSQRRWVQELFWRPALWVVLAVAAAALAGLRAGRWRLLVVLLAVPIGVLVSYAAQPAAQDARYVYAATLICQLTTVGYLATWWSTRRTRRVRVANEEES